MKSPSSMTIDSFAELKTTTTFAAAASGKENDVVSAAISLVIPPRPSSCNFQVGGTGKIYFEWQAHHFPAASLVPPKKKRGQKRAAIDVNDEHSLSMALDATRKL